MEMPTYSKRVRPNSLGVTDLPGVNMFSQVGSFNENFFKPYNSKLWRFKKSCACKKQTVRRISGPDTIMKPLLNSGFSSTAADIKSSAAANPIPNLAPIYGRRNRPLNEKYPVHRTKNKICRYYRQQWCRMVWGGRWLTSPCRRSKYINISKIQRTICYESVDMQAKILSFRDTGIIQMLQDQKSVAFVTALRMHTWLLNYRRSFSVCRAPNKQNRHYISRLPSMIMFSEDNGTLKKKGAYGAYTSSNRVYSDTSRLMPVAGQKIYKVKSKETFTSMDVFCPYSHESGKASSPNSNICRELQDPSSTFFGTQASCYKYNSTVPTTMPLPKVTETWSTYNLNKSSNFNPWSTEEVSKRSSRYNYWSPKNCYDPQSTQITNEFKHHRPVNFNSEVTASFAGYMPYFLQRLKDAIKVPPQNTNRYHRCSKTTNKSSTLTTKSIEVSTSTWESSGTNQSSVVTEQSLFNLNTSSTLISVLGTKECSLVSNLEPPNFTATSALTSQRVIGKKDCSVSTDPRMLTLAELQLLSISSDVIDRKRKKNIPETNCFSCQTQNLANESVAMEVTPTNKMKCDDIIKGIFTANPSQRDQNTQVQYEEYCKDFAIRTSGTGSVIEERSASISVNKTNASQSTEESSSSCRCINSATTTKSADTIDMSTIITENKTSSSKLINKETEGKSIKNGAVTDNENFEVENEMITKRLVGPTCQMVIKEAKNTHSTEVKKTHSTKLKNSAYECINTMLTNGPVSGNSAGAPLHNLLCISTMTEFLEPSTRFANVATSTEANNKVIVMHTKETQDSKILKLSTGQCTSRTSISNIDVQVSIGISKKDKFDREVSNVVPPSVSQEVQWNIDDIIISNVTTDEALGIQFVEPTNHATKTQLMRAIYKRESASCTSFNLDQSNNLQPIKYILNVGTSYDMSLKSEALSAINLSTSERTYKNVHVQYETPVPSKDRLLESERSQLISVFTLCNSYKDMGSQCSRTVENSTGTDFSEDDQFQLLYDLEKPFYDHHENLRQASVEQSSFLNPKLFVSAHSKPKVLERYSLLSLVSPDLISKSSLEVLLNLNIPEPAVVVDQDTSTTDILSLQRHPSRRHPATEVRSTGVITSRVLLPRGVCSEYFMTNSDCVFVYKKPRCILHHQFHADVGIQQYPTCRDIGTEIKVKQEHAVDEYDEVLETLNTQTVENHTQAASPRANTQIDTNSFILPKYETYATHITVAHDRNPGAVLPEDISKMRQIHVASQAKNKYFINIKAPSQMITQETEDIEETVPTKLPAQYSSTWNATGKSVPVFEKEPKVVANAFRNEYNKEQCVSIDEINKSGCATMRKGLPSFEQTGNKLSKSEETHLKLFGKGFPRSKFTCKANSYEDVPIIEKNQSENDRLDTAKISTETRPCYFLPEECSSKFISSIVYDTTYERRDNNTMKQAVSSSYQSADAIVLKDTATSAIKQPLVSATTSPFGCLRNHIATDPEPSVMEPKIKKIRQVVLNMDTKAAPLQEVGSHQTPQREDSLKEEVSFSTKLSVENCSSSPNICGDDKSSLNAVYNTLAAIEGRIRRLKLNMP